jgi:DNA-binding transcriptional MocR family regulator
MSMNLPPLFDDPALTRRMWSAAGAMERTGGLPLLLGYQDAGGSAADRAAGTLWLRHRLPDITEERVCVAAGTQGALLALTTLLAQRGDVVCAESLTYPGLRALAAHLGVSWAWRWTPRACCPRPLTPHAAPMRPRRSTAPRP